MSRRLAVVVLPLLLAVGPLSACTESTRIPPAEPTSAVEPLFSSDEEALAAATEAYEEYLAVSGQILREGGANPERLRPLVSAEVFASEAEGFAVLEENNWRATGDSVLAGIELQQHLPGPPGLAEVIAYVCVSVAGNDIVDEQGRSQVQADRQTQISFEVVLISNSNADLILDRKTLWSEEIACSSS